MADQRTTDLDPIAALPNNGVLDVVDVDDTSEDPAGTSKKITKANFLKEATAAILLNTAKVGITTNQAAAILLNTEKVGISTDQAAAVLLNTAKVGITTTQAAAILLNTAKVGITTDQAAAILLNTAKVGITTGQAAAILLNTAKVGITPAQATAITDNTANTSKVSINTDAASITNVRSLRYREETYSSNLDMVMQSSVGVYAWVNVFTIAFNVVNSLVTRFKNRVATDGGVFSNQTALETFLGTITGSLNTVLAAITPNAVKAGKLYSVIPNTSALDATVVRNTTATTINSSGIIVAVAANVPRISHTLNTGGEGFILDEPQRTNLVFPSSNKNDIIAGAIQGTYVANTSINSPDGLNLAYRFTPTQLSQSLLNGTSSSNNRLFIEVTGINTTYANSIFVKSVSGSNFNFAIKVINAGSDTEINSKIITVTNDWQRVDVVGLTNGSVAGLRFAIKSEQAVNLFGFGVEAGSTVSSYIPTTTTAVTRNADVITLAPPAGTLKITTTFSDNTTQVLTTIPATYTMPEGLIKSVNFNNTL